MNNNDANAVRSFSLIIQVLALFVVAISEEPGVIVPGCIVVMICTGLMIGVGGHDEDDGTRWYRGKWN